MGKPTYIKDIINSDKADTAQKSFVVNQGDLAIHLLYYLIDLHNVFFDGFDCFLNSNLRSGQCNRNRERIYKKSQYLAKQYII